MPSTDRPLARAAIPWLPRPLRLARLVQIAHGAVLSLLCAAPIFQGCGQPASAVAKSRPPPLVTVAKVRLRDVPVEVQAPVDLRPILQADVGSKTLGYLEAVLVDRGDRVRRGQLLALVRPSDLPDLLAAAKGQLQQAQAALMLARQNRERAQRLFPSGVVSQQENEASEAALAQAEAANAAAQANLAATATRLGETRIVSPLDGVVSVRRLDPGALVGPATGPLLTVVRNDVLRVFVTANELGARGLAVGRAAHVELDALPGQSFTGRVVRLAPAFDPLTRTLDAEIELPNKAGQLRPGMYGRGSVVIEVHPQAPTVPDVAVQISSGKRSVFVLVGEKAQRRVIETGVDNGEWLEVLRGLSGGEEVVIAGADGLDDGASVRVVRQVDPYTGEGLAGLPAAPGPSRAP
jgi:RND family efflux transporter MFP subunit